MLGWMAREFFAHSPLLLLPIAALLLFCVVFTVLAARVLLRPPADIDAWARMPLEDGGSGSSTNLGGTRP